MGVYNHNAKWEILFKKWKMEVKKLFKSLTVWKEDALRETGAFCGSCDSDFYDGGAQTEKEAAWK